MEFTALQQTLSLSGPADRNTRSSGIPFHFIHFCPSMLPIPRSSIPQSETHLILIFQPNVTSKFHPRLLDVSNRLKVEIHYLHFSSWTQRGRGCTFKQPFRNGLKQQKISPPGAFQTLHPPRERGALRQASTAHGGWFLLISGQPMFHPQTKLRGCDLQTPRRAVTRGTRRRPHLQISKENG